MTQGWIVVPVSLAYLGLLFLIAKETYQSPNIITLLFHTILTMAAIICLPRQFHTTVVENEQAQDLRTARWVFPLYLFLIGLLAFAAIAQFTPALIGGLYWRNANKKGVYAGLMIGFLSCMESTLFGIIHLPTRVNSSRKTHCRCYPTQRRARSLWARRS